MVQMSVSENWVPFLLLLMITMALLWWLGGRYARDAETPPADEPAPELPDNISNKVAAPIADDPAIADPQGDEIPVTKPAVPPKKAAPKKAAPVKPVAKTPPAKTETAAKSATPDNLELLKGVGPKLHNLLKSLGVTSFTQIARWNADDIAEIDSKLGNFAGRITRDNWVEQAKFLSAGDVAAFEAKYGALGGEIKKP